MAYREMLEQIQNAAEKARDIAEEIIGYPYDPEGDLFGITSEGAYFSYVRYGEEEGFDIPMDWIEMTENELRTHLTEKVKKEKQEAEEKKHKEEEAKALFLHNHELLVLRKLHKKHTGKEIDECLLTPTSHSS